MNAADRIARLRDYFADGAAVPGVSSDVLALCDDHETLAAAAQGLCNIIGALGAPEEVRPDFDAVRRLLGEAR